MHPIRRRKKRPNYGVRIVELCRGRNGFGFTISGQQPCILSCIVTGSPAEKAGLRPGDYLVAVNGQSVSKMPHDDVVRLIGCSSGVLRLHIAENYYSDSSDDDVILPRPKPKYHHKIRNGGCQHQCAVGVPLQSRAAKVVRDLRTGAMFEEHQLDVTSSTNNLTRSSVKQDSLITQCWEPPEPLPPPPPRLYIHPRIEKSRDIDNIIVFKAIVGYLGTIEMPKELQPSSRLQIVRSCIKRLRAEKRAHSLVLMTVYTRSLTLTNCHQSVIAEYPAERVIFCGTSSDNEHRYFGLVTAAFRNADDENEEEEEVMSSRSCHVFAVEIKLHGSHEVHAAKADMFKLNCSSDVVGNCPEFPGTSDPVVSAIKLLYSNKEDNNRTDNEEPLIANSPQPSNASTSTTTTSSNSDSGIGFRDDCGNQLDRILMVDIQNQRLHIQQVVNNLEHNTDIQPMKACVYDLAKNSPNTSKGIHKEQDRSTARLTVRAMPDPVVNLTSLLSVSSRSRSPLSSSSSDNDLPCKSKSRPKVAVTVDPALEDSNYGFGDYPSCKFLGDGARSLEDIEADMNSKKLQNNFSHPYKTKSYEDFSGCKIGDIFQSPNLKHSLHVDDYASANFSGVPKSTRSQDAMSIDSVKSQDPMLTYKLSPKVFGVSRPVAHSLEDLKVTENSDTMREMDSGNVNLSSSRGHQWGSLQELRSFVADCFETVPVIHNMISDQESNLEQEQTEQGAVSWSSSLEKLLEDPLGLQTFAKFLKKEFSHENIYFWVACEKYRQLKDKTERKKAAREIFDRHLCLGAVEPVNVDSHARQITQEGLEEASESLFMQAQKQIFNLMKFDSYPRFIKSNLYKECLKKQASGEVIVCSDESEVDIGLKLDINNDNFYNNNHKKLTKSRSDAEDHRQKSLLPWYRKNRSKSKDRGESEYNKLQMLQQKQDVEDCASVCSDVTSSRSSLASWDLALRGSFSRQSVTSGELQEKDNCALCRVILPDNATTVVQMRRQESIRDLVIRLLDKRGLHYNAFEVYVGNCSKAVSLDDDSITLSNKEVCVEPRVVFRLDLPDRKVIGVKAKPNKTLAEILKPILHKYGYKIELVTLCLMSENEVLNLNMPVTSVDNQRLQVLTRSVEAWKSEMSQKLKAIPSLDEITNKVFEELLQGKTDPNPMKSDQGSIRSEDWGSEDSSGIFGRFLRRDSAVMEKVKEFRTRSKKLGAANKHINEDNDSKLMKPPLIAKWKAGVKLQSRSESDELYEGLKRAQRSRLEDQRGTEINSELPDFLKDKENANQTGKKFRKLKRAEETNLKFCEPLGLLSQPAQVCNSSSESLLLSSNNNNEDYNQTSCFVTPFLSNAAKTDGIGRHTEDYLSLQKLDAKIEHNKKDIRHPGISRRTTKSAPQEGTIGNKIISSANRLLSDPPPLPPKPKLLPTKASVWSSATSTDNPSNFESLNNSNVSTDGKNNVRSCRSRIGVYLDQPSSSFV